MSHVVVGVDGSAAADEAFRVALDEARLRGAELTVVSAWTDRLATLAASLTRGHGPSETEAHAHDSIRRSLRAAGTSATDAVVMPLRMAAGPALVEASRDAELLVVGARGGGARDLLLGSTSEHCVHHAACPVLIVRRPLPTTGCRVVVGIAVGSREEAALEQAVLEGRLRSGSVEAVHAWSGPGETARPYPPAVAALQEMVEEARSVLDRAVERVDQRGLADPIIRTVMSYGAFSSLVDVAHRADLLVLGGPTHGPIVGRLIGSVSTQLVHRAPCSVMVVRAR